MPDLTFIIDIPVEVAESRKMEKEEGQLDRLEILDNEFFNRVREGYLTMDRQEERFKVIDGVLSIESISEKIINEVKRLEKKS